MSHFDLVVIGSGTGNSLVTQEMTDWDIAVVERGTFGGTCLNVGCIPTKMFVRAADVAAEVREGSRLGVDAEVTGVRWREIRDRVFGRIDPLSAGGRDWRAQGERTTVIEGTARFTGPRELDVDGERITADRIVIATGAHPVVPEALRDVPHHTSDTVMRLDELPRTMTIVGGGYIAAEMAHVFGSLGVAVTLVVRGPAMLRHLDEQVSAAFTERAREQWDVRLGTQVRSARAEGSQVVLDLDSGQELRAGLLLVATGRAPSTGLLDAAAGGVELLPDGRVRTDAHGRTTADGVWALGDAASPFQLKHVANAEGRVVAHNLVHPGELRTLPHEHVPAAVFSRPQIAACGLTEAEARAAGHDVAVAVQAYGDTAYGWALEDTTSFAKLVADRRTGRLLGAHIIGPEASLLVQPLVQAMATGQDAVQMARGQYWIHPALSEVVENALLGLQPRSPR